MQWLPFCSSTPHREHQDSQQLTASLPFSPDFIQHLTFSRSSILAAKSRGRKHKRIEVVDNEVFSQKYTLGDIIFPSSHRAMEIRSARRKSDDCEVVVKLRFKPACFVSKVDEHEWRSGMELMLNLPTSSGIAEILEVLEDRKAFYIIIEKAGGMDLRELLSRMKYQISLSSALEILAQLLEAVAHLHENGAIHRDLKLENVVVHMSDGCPSDASRQPTSPQALKIVDFDTVKEWSPKSAKVPHIQGTTQYIPQEAYSGQYSPLSDIFSLGVLGYRLIVGKFPFREDIFDDEGETHTDSPKMKQIQYRLKVTKVDWKAQVFEENPSLRELLQKMMAPREDLRPTAREALQHQVFCFETAISS